MTPNPNQAAFKPLRFGTSGLRDFDENLTDQEVFINTRGFLEYLLQLGAAGQAGGIKKGASVALAVDFRPSSRPDRIPRAVAAAILDAGCRVIYCGCIPTPTVANYGFRHGLASIMVTGSHIPFGQNGIKFNRPDGEVLKTEEAPILDHVAQFRAVIANWRKDRSWFDEHGAFLAHGSTRPALANILNEAGEALCSPHQSTADEYVARYVDAFGPDALRGMELVFYQQSAVGREILPAILRALGASVVTSGPLNVEAGEFLPVDTEKMTDEIRVRLRELSQQYERDVGRKPFAVLSADGDSDRPVFCDENGEFVPGDRLGVLAALYLKPNFVALPITCNSSAVGLLQRMAKVVQTQVGSPYINKAMRDALIEDPQTKAVGYEANGGFLIGANWQINGGTLPALPTRDAALPMICALLLARQGRVARPDGADFVVEKISDLQALFNRHTASGVVDRHDGVPYESPETGRRIISLLIPTSAMVEEVGFAPCRIACQPDHNGIKASVSGGAIDLPLAAELNTIAARLSRIFSTARGFAPTVKINRLDGVRIYFQNGDVVHLRPSGNAPEFRFYAEADSPQRAQALCDLRVDIVRRMMAELGG